MIEVKDLTVSFGNLKIVDRCSFSLPDGRWLMIVGPNGAGKSTLINAISRGVSYTGSVFADGRDVAAMRPRELSRTMGVLSQHHFVGYSFSVLEIVSLGRYSYSPGVFGSTSDEDTAAIEAALRKTGLYELRHQSVSTLSGGELQRTFLAQLLAQNPGLLILDEPTNHLDLVYQKQVFELIREWIRETGRSVVSVVHDLSLARAFGTDALLMSKGKTVAFGKADEVLTAENLRNVYSMDVYGWMQQMLSQWQGE